MTRYSSQMGYTNAPSEVRESPMDNSQMQMLLAHITNSDDPDRWLEYLMNKNGDSAGLSGGGNPISNLISSLFMGILTLAQDLQGDDNVKDLQASKGANENKETKEAASIRRDRESVDVKQLAQTASLNFDSDLPEEQQANNIKRA